MQQPPPPPPPGPSVPYASQLPSGYGQYGFAQPQGYPPPRRRRWWLWGCGGCALLVLILLGIGVAVGIGIFTSSPLRHFPVEAGASTVRDNFQIVNGQSGETLVIDDPHSLTDVEAFYQSALHSNGWTADTVDPSQAANGDSWRFSKSGASTQAGSIAFVNLKGVTQVTVTYVY